MRVQVKPQLTELQQAVAAYISRVLEAKGGITIYRLSKLSKVPKSTLGRWHEPVPGKGLPRLDNLKKVIDIAPEVDPPEGIMIPADSTLNGGTHHARGFAEPDVVAIRDERQECPLAPLTPNQSVWQLRSRALELPPYSFKPGDYLLLDMSVQPMPGQAVCAQVYDRQGGAETVFRAFEPPFLVVATQDERIARTPVIVDGNRVVLMGTVIKSVRLA